MSPPRPSAAAEKPPPFPPPACGGREGWGRFRPLDKVTEVRQPADFGGAGQPATCATRRPRRPPFNGAADGRIPLIRLRLTLAAPGRAGLSFALAVAPKGLPTPPPPVSSRDAGDDPRRDARLRSCSRRVRAAAPGSGVTFRARGPGVGTVTRPGLPVPPGARPCHQSRAAPDDVRRHRGKLPRPRGAGSGDVESPRSGVADGERLAAKTLNARLGYCGRPCRSWATTGIVVAVIRARPGFIRSCRGQSIVARAQQASTMFRRARPGFELGRPRCKNSIIFPTLR